MSNDLTTTGRGFDLSPQTFEQALTFSTMLAESDLVPKDFKGKPGNCMIAMQWGAELGLKPLQALQNLAIINGRPALWGDAVIALVRGSPLCEYVKETDDGKEAACEVKRRGEPAQVRTFSTEDAQKAGLLGKSGPWSQYPKRMRQMRARAFALRDVFADVLRGMPVAEEVMDMGPRDMGMAQEVTKPAAALPGLPPYSDEAFAQNLPAWSKVVESGRKTAAELLAMLSTKATFSDEQRARVLALVPAEKKAEPEVIEQPSAPADDFAAAYESAEGAQA